jgi:hypothetical protein
MKQLVHTNHIRTLWKKLVLFAALILGVMNVHGQDYNHAVKLKILGHYWGASYKYLTEFEKGYEVLFHSNSQGINVTGLRVFQKPAFPIKSDKWFFCYGYGVHTSFYDHYEVYNPFTPFDPPRRFEKNFVSMGLDGYAGLEYRFLKHPFIVSIDFIPNFEFFGPDYFRVNTNNLCFGLAYYF